MQAGLGDGVDLGVAGDDIGKVGLLRRLDVEVRRLRGNRRLCLARRLSLRRTVPHHRGANADGQQSRNPAPARQHLAEAAGQRDHHERIEDQQRQRGEEYRPAQIERLAVAVDVVTGVEARDIERRRAVFRRERIDRHQAFRRPIEAGRMIGIGAPGEIRRDRPRGRRRAGESAEAIEHARRRHGLRRGVVACHAGFFIAGGGDRPRQRDDAPQHIDEGPRQRQIRPARVGGDVEQHQQSLAAALRGDQRRTVGQRRPGAVGELRIRLGQHLAGHGHVIGDRHAVERAFARETGKRLRLVPAHTAAQDAAATAQLDRHQVVIGARQMRAGKAHQHAAALDPCVQTLARLGEVADIGQDQHRQVLVEKAVDRFRRRHALGEPHVGERVERARKIISGADQRLRAVGDRAGHDADGAPAPTLVEQLHAACRALADDFQPRHVVADLDRQVDHRIGLARIGGEGEPRLAERQSPEVDGVDDAVVGAAAPCAQHFHRQRAGRVVGGGQRMGRRQPAFDDGEGMIADDVFQPGDELPAGAEIDAVAKPHQLDVGRRLEEAVDRRQRLAAVDAIGLRLELLDLHARGAGELQGNVAPGFRQRQHGDAAVVGVGARDQLVGGAQALVPGRRRRPAVVEQDQKRRATVGGGQRRIPQRAGGGDDDQPGERQPQQGQPPRRARRRFLLRRDFEQQPRRGEVDAARARRHQPQQPPQNWQAEQTEQHQRLREAEGEGADHVRASAAARTGPRLLAKMWAPAPIRPWMANSSSVGPRSVW